MCVASRSLTSCHDFRASVAFGRSLGKTAVLEPVTGVQHPSRGRDPGRRSNTVRRRGSAARPLTVRPFGRMLASYTVNEFGDSFAIVALARSRLRQRPAKWPHTAALFIAGKFVPALIAPVPDGPPRSAPRAPRPLPWLYVIEALAFVALAWIATSDFHPALVLALALVDGAVAVTARALTRGAIAALLQPARLLSEGNALLNIGFAVRSRGRLGARRPAISEFGLSAALLVDACVIRRHRDRARSGTQPAQAPGRATGDARTLPERARVRAAGSARPPAAGRPVARADPLHADHPDRGDLRARRACIRQAPDSASCSPRGAPGSSPAASCTSP